MAGSVSCGLASYALARETLANTGSRRFRIARTAKCADQTDRVPVVGDKAVRFGRRVEEKIR